ncbi:hypothetical protein FACS1894200_09240 [Spirochaetia bacterium]|nr:hypothetical protein FACS1894200_09240 [Spirochaetia bacterium]
MKQAETEGNCFLCGVTLKKIKMKNHVLKAHLSEANDEKVMLVKAEGFYSKDYWLLLDIALNAGLTDLDSFLRRIWLECCQHMSAFRPMIDRRVERESVAMSRKIKDFAPGDKLVHEYDFGSKTSLLITMLAGGERPPQKAPVRLLARNVPRVFRCTECGKPAEILCYTCSLSYGYNDASCYCEACFEKHDCRNKECSLPILNSPRSGVCGYCGERDVWNFDPERIAAGHCAACTVKPPVCTCITGVRCCDPPLKSRR